MSTVPPEQQDEVARWLVQLAAAVGEKGWGQEHQLWLCSTKPIGKGMFGEPLTQVVFNPAPLPQIGLHQTHHYLNQMAAELRMMPDFRREILGTAVHGDLFALALSSEVWVIPPEDIPAWRGRDWAEHPRREDALSIMCVDVNARVYSISRKRFSDQVDTAHDGIEGVLGVRGVVPDALKNVLLAFLGK